MDAGERAEAAAVGEAGTQTHTCQWGSMGQGRGLGAGRDGRARGGGTFYKSWS